jgi:hypothetical protein
MLPKDQNKLAILDENRTESTQKRAYQAPRLHHDLLRHYTKHKLAYNSYEVHGTLRGPHRTVIRTGQFGSTYPRNS